MGLLQKTDLLHMLRQLTVIILVLAASSVHAELSRQDVDRIIKKGIEQSKQITIPVNKYEREGREAAERMNNKFYSPDFQKKIEEQKQCIQEEDLWQYQKPWKKQIDKAAAHNQIGSLAANARVLLFISSSMPDETVNTYIADLDRIREPGVQMIMRGIPGGFANIRGKGKASWFARITKKNPACREDGNRKTPCERYQQVSIRMKPELFSRYNISAVPAVIFDQEQDVFIIQGDAGLDYLLERINREAKSSALSGLIAKIRGSNGKTGTNRKQKK